MKACSTVLIFLDPDEFAEVLTRIILRCALDQVVIFYSRRLLWVTAAYCCRPTMTMRQQFHPGNVSSWHVSEVNRMSALAGNSGRSWRARNFAV
jgi:hypothetical protein